MGLCPVSCRRRHHACHGRLEVTTHGAMFFVILLNSLAYMPTLGPINTTSYYRLRSAGMDIVTDFPLSYLGHHWLYSGVWGVSFSVSAEPRYGFISARRFLFCWYCLPLPCRTFPVGEPTEKPGWTSMLGL